MIHLDIPKMTQKRVTTKKNEDYMLFRMSETQLKIEETIKKERIQETRDTIMRVE